MSDIRGRFLWYELMTTDPDAALGFYRGVIGWSTAPFDGGGTDAQPYTMFMKGEMPIAGCMELPAEAQQHGAPPHWIGYVGVPDVDATLERVKEQGGVVVFGPMDIANVGRLAGIQDPQGAVIAVFTPESDMPDAGSPEVGCFSWHELATTDIDGAMDFYSDVFGWEKGDAMDMGEGNMYQMFRRPGGPDIGGVYVKMPEMPVCHWMYYAKVPDAAKATETVSASGGQVMNGPMEVPGGDMVAQCMDPQGAAFAVHASA